MKRVLNICDKHGFLKPVGSGSQPDYFKFGPAGEFLSNNIRHEWLLSNVIQREENVFPFHNSVSKNVWDWSGIKEPFLSAKSLNSGQLPFGLADMQSYLCSKPDNVCHQTHPQVFCPQWRTPLRSFMFISPNDAIQYFYTWQQNRKMWWRKFSAYPGRFSLSDIKEKCDIKCNENVLTDQKVNILAKFDWGVSVVETVQVYACNSVALSSESLEDFKARDGRKSVCPWVVESATSLEEAAIVFLCDAFCETSSSRRLLRLHRRLAPYKVGFVASVNELSVFEKLRELAQHLSTLLRRCGLTTLLLPDMAKRSYDSQLIRNDEIGIPFTVVLRDSSLSDGIIHLYSRETTLKEQVHVSQLTKYLELLMKNY